jgi:WD40 repeat protein
MFCRSGREIAKGRVVMLWEMWDLVTKHVRRSPRATIDVRQLVYSPDGRVVALGNDNNIEVWDAETLQPRAILSSPLFGMIDMAFSPDGKLLAAGGTDTAVHLWDVTNGQELYALRGHVAAVRHVTFSPDGRTLASWGESRDENAPGQVILWRSAGP